MLLGNTHDKTDGRQLPIGVCDDQIALRFVADDDISFPLGLRESGPGTFETCQRILTMSALKGISEVRFSARQDRF
jgi:hypothetical protein